MKLQFRNIVLGKDKKRRAVLSVSVLILVFVFMLGQHGVYYVHSFLASPLDGSKDVQVGYRGENITIIVRMVDLSGYPIISEEVYFKDLTNNEVIGGAYTNSSGYAVLVWGIPYSYRLGFIRIQATCPNRSDAIPVDVDILIKARTVFENITYPASVSTGEDLVVEAYLTDDTGNAVSDRQVYLCDYQDINLAESVTDIYGHCRLIWRIPQGMITGQYSFKVKFDGDQLYGLAENEFNVTILPQHIGIISITLNITRTKPNTPILVSVELNYSDPLVSIMIDNDTALVKSERNIWKGIINAPATPGKYVLNVIVFYNGTQRINDSSTYYVVEADKLDFSLPLVLLSYMGTGDSFNSRNTILISIFALSISSAVIAWRKKRRQPSFSRDYTLEASIK